MFRLSVLLGWFFFQAGTPAAASAAGMRLPDILGDHAVLQRDEPVPIWGRATPGETVKVFFAGQEAETVADDEGRWMVRLDAMSAGGPHELRVVNGGRELLSKDVLVGDVWLGAGQSNMVGVMRHQGEAEDIASADNPSLRFFNVRDAASYESQEDVSGAWRKVFPGGIETIPAIPYYFGRDLQEVLDIPVGVIASAKGNTQIECWIPRDAMLGAEGFRSRIEDWKERLSEYPDALENFPAYFEKWDEADIHFRSVVRRAYREAVRNAREKGEPEPEAPQRPDSSVFGIRAPTVWYHGMIAPLTRQPLRGILWYQGESNAGRPDEYRVLLPMMIQSWREAWQQPEMPFLLMQLANFREPAADANNNDRWPHIREAQRLTARETDNVEMAVAIDIGEAGDIHPKPKTPFGRRLALLALESVYGREVSGRSPLFLAVEREEEATRVRFANATGGLSAANGGAIKGFALAGEDRRFHAARVEVEGEDALLLTAPEVPDPHFVRYAWADNPVEANLVNAAGLPASPFQAALRGEE